MKEESTSACVIYELFLPLAPIYASPCLICSDPLWSSFSLTTHWYSPTQQRWADLSHVSGRVLMVAFILELMKSATVMWWNECFVHQLPPSTEIDGACNWWPLSEIAKINRHCCRHERSMSRTKQVRAREKFMSRHIHQQQTVTIVTGKVLLLLLFYCT